MLRHTILALPVVFVCALNVCCHSLLASDKTAPPQVVDTSPADVAPVILTAIGKVPLPDTITESELVKLYERIRSYLVTAYEPAGSVVPRDYQRWRRYNRVPYISPMQGGDYVVNYANELGRGYGNTNNKKTFPVGTILIKDRFGITENGQVVVGTLSVMEKMPKGFNPASRDWRFTEVLSDGSIVGTTRGVNDDKVLACLGCHFHAGAKQDYVFFVPTQFRLQPSSTTKP